MVKCYDKKMVKLPFDLIISLLIKPQVDNQKKKELKRCLQFLSKVTIIFYFQVYNSRVETTKALRDAVVKCGSEERPKVFVQVTGVGYYPPSQQTVYDESSPGKYSQPSM